MFRQKKISRNSMLQHSGLRLSAMLCGALILACTSVVSLASVIPPAVVSGHFIYEREKTDGDAAMIAYQVDAVAFRGNDAWRIAWSDARMDAEHFIRRADGAALYVRRVDHAQHSTVEITYSLDPGKPHIYRREGRDGTLIRRIRQAGLIDMGSLPQVLAGVQAARSIGVLHFSAIDYSDGQVYQLVARRVGYVRAEGAGQTVDCAVYETNLDSWKAAFNPAAHLQVPMQAGLTNFSSYSGPDPAGSGEITTLRMISRNNELASLAAPVSLIQAR